MGTNYYARRDPELVKKDLATKSWEIANAEDTDRVRDILDEIDKILDEDPDDKYRSCSSLHIGKSSIGWAFTFRVYPGFINDVGRWATFLSDQSICIFDEYNRLVSKAEFWDRVESVKHLKNGPFHYCDREFS